MTALAVCILVLGLVTVSVADKQLTAYFRFRDAEAMAATQIKELEARLAKLSADVEGVSSRVNDLTIRQGIGND